MATGEDDPFLFFLAERLGKHLHEMDMPHADYARWAAYYLWRGAQDDLARRVADMRAARR